MTTTLHPVPARLPGTRAGRANRFRLAMVVTAALLLLMAADASGQMVVDTIEAPAGDEWRDLALYRAGGKLFVLDYTGTRILVYDSHSLSSAGEIPLSSYAPDAPQQLVLHEGTGTLYVAISTGFATSTSRVVVVDADTLAAGPVITGVGLGAYLAIDETRSRLYVVSASSQTLSKTLTAIDVNTNTPAGSLDLGALMSSGLMAFNERHLNPATGELFFSNLHHDQFLVVNGPAMTGQVLSVAGSRGWGGTWNPVENKICITKSAWNGYFLYDRDTASSNVTTCVNDGTELFFSGATNRVYSGAEVNGDSTVIEGATDGCQNLEVGSGQPIVVFVAAQRKVFFGGNGAVSVYDEDSLELLTSFVHCGSGGYGAVGTKMIADPDAGRVFAQSTWSSPSRGSCILVIDNPSLAIESVSTTEGNAGTKTVTFTVTLDPPAASTVTVQYATSNGTASSGTDYQATSGTLTVPAGETTATFDVVIHGDTVCEPDETFLVDLSGASAGVFIAAGQATGTITDDDTPPPPSNVVATANNATSIAVAWGAVSGAASYDVYRSASGGNFVKIGSTAGSLYTDTSAASGTAYLYAVQSIGANCASELSASDLATTVVLTDPVIAIGATIVKAAHVTQLRSMIAAVRTLAGLGAFSYTDPTIAAHATAVKAVHITQMRGALDAARSALGLPPLSYTNAVLTPTVSRVRAVHISELRNGAR